MLTAGDRRWFLVACAVLIVFAVGGWTVRHRVAYEIQLPRGSMVVKSIPAELAVPWLVETLRTDPILARRTTAAGFLRHFRDTREGAKALLEALGDPSSTLEMAAWDSLNRPRCAFLHDCLPRAVQDLPTEDFLKAVTHTTLADARCALFVYIANRRTEGADEASRALLVGSPDESTLDCILQRLGGPRLGWHVALDPGMTRSRARSIASAGLKSPLPSVRRRTMEFLIMLGGPGLCETDRDWISEASRDPALARDGLVALWNHRYCEGREAGTRSFLDPDPTSIEPFLQAAYAVNGLECATLLARAGAASEDLAVSLLCRHWLDHHDSERADAKGDQATR